MTPLWLAASEEADDGRVLALLNFGYNPDVPADGGDYPRDINLMDELIDRMFTGFEEEEEEATGVLVSLSSEEATEEPTEEPTEEVTEEVSEGSFDQPNCYYTTYYNDNYAECYCYYFPSYCESSLP